MFAATWRNSLSPTQVQVKPPPPFLLKVFLLLCSDLHSTSFPSLRRPTQNPVGCLPTQPRLLGWWTPVIKHTDGLHTQCRPAMYGWMCRPDLWLDHPAGPTITCCSNSSSSPPPRFHLIKIRCSGPGVSTAYGTSPSKVAGGSPSGSTD